MQERALGLRQIHSVFGVNLYRHNGNFWNDCPLLLKHVPKSWLQGINGLPVHLVLDLVYSDLINHYQKSKVLLIMTETNIAYIILLKNVILANNRAGTFRKLNVCVYKPSYACAKWPSWFFYMAELNSSIFDWCKSTRSRISPVTCGHLPTML